ncbi:zinc finger protein ubi-d4 [Eurytemora carolleeae]|uniref:zinc finger protein ubi-d4 n=1 Tax=Eurytemora carolleeae TaxID=1294199 RepID=UPI000C7615BE|nr:zinc finger protein ubi-d4 [Eurytemora carolleeae]|eukprot:XP_023327298.1 zinc finger protein ubi-d4-like [Eurytemora affinis]
MVLEMKISPEAVTKVERFLVTDSYRELAESAMSFNRRLNEERKMRIPYIDGQTGVAQKHYNAERKARERMPGRTHGQIYSYPQNRWRKKRYQYLQYFMQPRHLRFEPDCGSLNVSKVEPTGVIAEETILKLDTEKNEEWSGMYEDDFPIPEPEDDAQESDSDFEFDGVRIKKTKGRKMTKTKSTKPNPTPPKVKDPTVPKPPQPNKRRTHADSIPDSEKPFTCDLCCARYKTRPGLTYHYNHTHKGRAEPETYSYFQEEEEGISTGSPSAGSDSQEGSGTGRAKTDPFSLQVEDETVVRGKSPAFLSKMEKSPKVKKGPTPTPLVGSNPGLKPGPAPYCDFCLGDSALNKKTLTPEELIGCAECGRSGHPTCLQFTGNMMVSVRQYPWQCIECKTCTLCGTSENDDQLLFCDDCDRGFHMYCLVPPMKIAPEGSWSCHICMDIFHGVK